MGKGEINLGERIREDSYWEIWVGKNRFYKAYLQGKGLK